MTESGALEEGWLRQLHRSAGGGDKFLLNPKLFAPQTKKELMRFDWNKNIYRNEGIGKDNKYSTGLIGSKFNSFKRCSFKNYTERVTKVSPIEENNCTNSSMIH